MSIDRRSSRSSQPAFALELNGLSVLDSYGCFADGWCERGAAFRLETRRAGAGIAATVWTKEEPGLGSVPFELQIPGGGIASFATAGGEKTQLILNRVFSAGEQLVLALRSPHRVIERGDDERELSFILSCLSVV